MSVHVPAESTCPASSQHLKVPSVRGNFRWRHRGDRASTPALSHPEGDELGRRCGGLEMCGGGAEVPPRQSGHVSQQRVGGMHLCECPGQSLESGRVRSSCQTQRH